MAENLVRDLATLFHSDSSPKFPHKMEDLLNSTISILAEAALFGRTNGTMTSKPWTPVEPPKNKCDYFVKNETVIIFDFGNQYGGIPQNLVLNLVSLAGSIGKF